LIRKRGRVWQAQVRVGRDPRTGRWVWRCATRDTRREAEQAERALLAQAEALQQRWVQPVDLTLAAYLEEWLRRKETQRRTSTVEQYSRIIRLHIVPVLGDIRLQDLAPRKIQRWLDGMGPRRITEYARTVLVDALGEAQRLGLVADNAAARTEVPARPKPRRPAFTVEEIVALFRAAEGERIAPLIKVLAFTGLRRGEALGLKWSDVSWSQSAVLVQRQVSVIRGKPGAGRPEDGGGTPRGALGGTGRGSAQGTAASTSGRAAADPGGPGATRIGFSRTPLAAYGTHPTWGGRFAACGTAPACGHCPCTPCGTPQRPFCWAQAWNQPWPQRSWDTRTSTFSTRCTVTCCARPHRRRPDRWSGSSLPQRPPPYTPKQLRRGIMRTAEAASASCRFVSANGLHRLPITASCLQTCLQSRGAAHFLPGGFLSIACGSKILSGGGKGIRTPGLVNAIHALSQLSYTPTASDAAQCTGGVFRPSSEEAVGACRRRPMDAGGIGLRAGGSHRSSGWCPRLAGPRGGRHRGAGVSEL